MYDVTGAKRYVLRELMELMDKNDREKLKGSFKPDSQPWQDETGTTNKALYEAQMSDAQHKREHEDDSSLTNVDKNSSVDSQGSGSVDEPSSDSVNELSRKRNKNKSSY